MNAPTGLDFASISDRVQSEVQRAIQRSIKGVEYFSSSGPALGSTPKDVLLSRGTLQLYHYRPLSDEIYRVPILIVMATTNRGYILDMVPGQSFIEFLLKRGYDVYMMDWTAPKPEEKVVYGSQFPPPPPEPSPAELPEPLLFALVLLERESERQIHPGTSQRALDELMKLLQEQDLETLGLTYKTLFGRIAEPREDVKKAEELVRQHFTGEIVVEQ